MRSFAPGTRAALKAEAAPTANAVRENSLLFMRIPF
jgi:hypothetical protein